MGRIAIVVVMMLVLLGMAGGNNQAYSQEQAVPMQISYFATAKVLSVNLDSSTVLLETVNDPYTKNYETKTISVTPETKILNGDVAMKLSDLKIGDKVMVKYSADSSTEWKIESISVQSIESSK